LKADALGRTLQLRHKARGFSDLADAPQDLRLREMGSSFITFAACALVAIASRAFAQPASPELEDEAGAAESAWTFVVIKLQYADAEHVASVLRQLLPRTINVVPYQPKNSVLISGDPAVIGDIEAMRRSSAPSEAPIHRCSRTICCVELPAS
jgi:Bacterial type II/III secretion system short domain